MRRLYLFIVFCSAPLYAASSMTFEPQAIAWQTKSMHKLQGSRVSSAMQLQFSYAPTPLQVSFAGHITPTASENIAKNIGSEMDLWGIDLGAGYVFSINENSQFIAGLTLGIEEIDLFLLDRKGNDSEEFGEDAPIFGYSLAWQRLLSSQWMLGVRMQQLWARYRFIDIGSVDANRLSFGVSFSYLLGG